MDTETAPLAVEIDGFVETNGMSPITFGRKALGDPHFVKQLKAGRRVWPETESKVRRFMEAYRAGASA